MWGIYRRILCFISIRDYFWAVLCSHLLHVNMLQYLEEEKQVDGIGQHIQTVRDSNTTPSIGHRQAG